MDKNLIISKSNKLIEASYRLTLQEVRVIEYCISKINPMADFKNSQLFTLKAKDFSAIFKVSLKNSHRELVKVADRLFERHIIIEDNEKKNGILKTRWISSVRYKENEGEIDIKFAQDIVPYLHKIKNGYTSYRLECVAELTSVYAVRLYQLLLQWGGTKSRERVITIEDLKVIFQLEGSYKVYREFNRRILKPSIEQINKFTDIKVKFHEVKTGRKVTGLLLGYTYKSTFKEAKKKKRIQIEKKPANNHKMNDSLKSISSFLDTSLLNDKVKEQENIIH